MGNLFHLYILFMSITVYYARGRPEKIIQERKGFLAVPGALKTFAKNEDVQTGLAESVFKLAAIDFKAPTDVVIKNVADTLVPVIAAGLSLIPGGAIISGIVTGAWSLISGLFGGGGEEEKKEDPMKKVIDDIYDELNKIRKSINSLGKKLTEEREKRLNQIVTRILNGELKRNMYICTKYADVSETFTDDMKNNKSIQESTRIEMIAYIQDCDDFLKDTIEGFVFPEFAEELWLPSLMTTIMRVGFLAEVSSYSISLKLEPTLMRTFIIELKKTTRQHLHFYGQYIRQRIVTYNKIQKADARGVVNASLTSKEESGCKMQQELLYMDRELYPYGVPESIILNGDSTQTIKMSDYITNKSDTPQHFQVLYNNEHELLYTDSTDGFVNCFVQGPRFVMNDFAKDISYNVEFLPDKLYEVKILYMSIQSDFSGHLVFDDERGNTDREVAFNMDEENVLQITISTGKPSNTSVSRHGFSFGVIQSACDVHDLRGFNETSCAPLKDGYLGTLFVELFTAINTSPVNNKMKMAVTNEAARSHSGKELTFVFGMEFVAFPNVTIEKIV